MMKNTFSYWKLGGCLATIFWSLNFHHSSLITHNSSLITLNTKAIWHHHSFPISQYFSHYLWVSYLSLVQLFLFLFSSVPQLTKPSEKKKKSKVKSCGWVLFVGPLCVFNYNIVIELWVMETEISQNVFSVSITHNSKIRELSDENRVIVCQTTFFVMGSTIF